MAQKFGVFSAHPGNLIEYNKYSPFLGMLRKMPKDIAPIIRLHSWNSVPFELFYKNIALRLRCCFWGRRISRKEQAFYFFAEFSKQPAFPNSSSSSHYNQIRTSSA